MVGRIHVKRKKNEKLTIFIVFDMQKENIGSKPFVIAFVSRIYRGGLRYFVRTNT